VYVYASLSYGKQNRKKQVRTRIGRRTRQLSKSALLALGTRGNKKKKTQRNRFCHKSTHIQLHTSRPDLDLKIAPCGANEGWVGCFPPLFELSPCEWANRKIRNLNMLLFEFSLVLCCNCFAQIQMEMQIQILAGEHRYSPQSAADSDTFTQIQHEMLEVIVWVQKWVVADASLCSAPHSPS